MKDDLVNKDDKNNLVNIRNFLKEKELFFETEKKEIAWVKRHLQPSTWIRASSNVLVDRQEIEELFKIYINGQRKIYQQKVARAKNLSKNSDEIT